jgi:hypothetical protein
MSDSDPRKAQTPVEAMLTMGKRVIVDLRQAHART